MSVRTPFRRQFGSKARPRARLALEALEDRLVPAVQLGYGGPGTALSLRELVNGATPAVTLSEPTSGQLRIDLGAQTFDARSTAAAAGLAYEIAGSPGTSHFATLDVSQANDIPTLQATLSGDELSLGAITNGSGGLGNVALSAARITVTGLDTSHAGAGQGNVDLRSAGELTVASGALLETGTGTLALAAGVNANGTASGNSGVLFVADGATVVSDNAGSNALTLRGAQVELDIGPDPALVGAHRGTTSESAPRPASGGVLIRTAQADQPISVGAETGPGLALSNAELAQVFTAASGTLTFGDAAQTGDITFTAAAPAITAGASVVALQAVGGPGTIALDGTAGTALAAGVGNVHLSAGRGGIVAKGEGGTASLASSGQVILDTRGAVGTADAPVLFEATVTPATVTVGSALAPDGVHLVGLGGLTLADVQTANDAALDVRAPNLTVAGTLRAGDVFVGGLSVTVNQGAGVTAGDGKSLTVMADSLSLLGTLSAGGNGVVWLRPNQPDRAIDLGGTGPNTHLVLDDSALSQVTAGTLRVGDSSTGDVTVTGDVTSHPGYDTLSLLSDRSINTANGATLTAANLALQAGTGIGTAGAVAIDASQLAFASNSGPIQLSDAGAVTLTGVDTLSASSIPGDVYSSASVGGVVTLLSAGGGVSGQISYQGQALAEGATLTLADGNHYRVSYQGDGGQDVTLTRVANPAPVAVPSPQAAAPSPQAAAPVLSQVAVQRSRQGGPAVGATLTFDGPVTLYPHAVRLVQRKKGGRVKDLSRRIRMVLSVENGQTRVQLRFRFPKGEQLARGHYSLFVQHDLIRHALTGAALSGPEGGRTEIRFTA